jgi:hypothetical protein
MLCWRVPPVDCPAPSAGLCHLPGLAAAAGADVRLPASGAAFLHGCSKVNLIYKHSTTVTAPCSTYCPSIRHVCCCTAVATASPCLLPWPLAACLPAASPTPPLHGTLCTSAPTACCATQVCAGWAVGQGVGGRQEARCHAPPPQLGQQQPWQRLATNVGPCGHPRLPLCPCLLAAASASGFVEVMAPIVSASLLSTLRTLLADSYTGGRACWWMGPGAEAGRRTNAQPAPASATCIPCMKLLCLPCRLGPGLSHALCAGLSSDWHCCH